MCGKSKKYLVILVFVILILFLFGCPMYTAVGFKYAEASDGGEDGPLQLADHAVYAAALVHGEPDADGVLQGWGPVGGDLGDLGLDRVDGVDHRLALALDDLALGANGFY